MIDTQLLQQLRQIAGPEHVFTGPLDVEVYSYDASLAAGTPDAVVLPGDAAETSAVTKEAARAGVPVTPRGFGTNLSGGSIAPQGGVVLCFARMDRILSIDPDRRCATVQPGVTNFELQEALAPLGYYYAPDPASQKVSTFGGNVAENAGGPHCVKYGVTTDHVLGMQIVLPGGQIVRTGGQALDPPGYDLRGLVVGSEGTLAAVTEITVRILPKPESVVTMLAIYDTLADAARSVSSIIAKGIVPATLEMMDAPVIRAVQAKSPCGYPDDAAAVLIIEVEGLAPGLREEAAAIQDICAANACRTIQEAKDDSERDQLWAGRRGAFGALSRIAPNFYSADCTVPRNKLPEALERVAEIAVQHGLQYANVLHAGDGNLHPVLFFDGRQPGQSELVHRAGHEIMQACVALGGTLTGEHGIGVEKMGAMPMVFSEDSLDHQRTIRGVFDPDELFNPGKIFPPAEAVEDRPAAPVSSLEGEMAPADATEARDMVAAAIASQTALLPAGGGRRADFGNTSDPIPTLLRSHRLSSVIEYDPDTQVVILGAGMTLADTQKLLAPHNQWLPIRPPLADGCTLGGMAALGACGPERLAYGAPRDRLLGLRFVSGRGREIKAGGKVVKNVAGYDVTRLLAGSAGTLGFLTELTFCVATVPEVCRMVTAAGPLPLCAAAAGDVLRTSLGPAFVVAKPTDREPQRWELAIGFEGFDVTVRHQTERCTAMLRDAEFDVGQERNYPVHEGPHGEHFRRLYDAPFLLRADLPLDEIERFVSGSQEAPRTGDVLLDFGCGRVTAGLSSLCDETWSNVCALSASAGGHAVLEKAPAEFKHRHDVFGPRRPEWALMHRIKRALDPHNIFAPGRLPGRK